MKQQRQNFPGADFPLRVRPGCGDNEIGRAEHSEHQRGKAQLNDERKYREEKHRARSRQSEPLQLMRVRRNKTGNDRRHV